MTASCTKFDELQKSIAATKQKIHRLQQQLASTTDHNDRLQLKHQLKDLRQLQFQQIGQLG